MAMLYPTYTDIIDSLNQKARLTGDPEIHSRYSVVIAAAKRARQIVDGAHTSAEYYNEKPLSAAIDELYDGQIAITKTYEE